MFVRFLPCTLVLLVACASHPASTVPPAVVDEAQLASLYAEADSAAAAYRAGLALIAAGSSDPGRVDAEAASGRLRDVVARCTALPGCDVARVVALYDALLLERTQTRADDGENFAAFAPETSAAGEGEATQAPAEESPITAAVPEAARSLNLLHGRDLADVIALHTPVKAALTEWLTWLRPNLISAWTNYQYMRDRMWPEFEKAGLPEAILFGILAKESGGRVHAVSRSGASGPLQFMYVTGLRYGLGNVDGFDTRFDPQLAARANVRYLNDRFAEFNNDLELALAAYNGGEGRVARLYRESGGKSFWSEPVYTRLPAETRDYVAMVLAAALLFLNPDHYGLEFPTIDNASASLRLLQPASINELAICLGSVGNADGWFRPLRNLNPRYEAHTIIPTGTELTVPAAVVPMYAARCVDGPAHALAQDLASARRSTPPAMQSAAGHYVVRSGDTLDRIARRNRCGNPKALAAANGIRAPHYLIRPGQKLNLSGCRGP